MQDRVWRNELKHELNNCDFIRVDSFVKAVAKVDEHAGSNGYYKIRSLYFDNVYDKALCEKQDGLNEREKFRIRIYNDDPSIIKLEKKMRYEGKSLKVSCEINKDECDKIISGDTGFMLGDKRELMCELYAKMKSQQLRPYTIVDYTRKAYTYPAGNVRITFDYNLRTIQYSNNIFDNTLPTMPVYDGIILEVKYDNFIPEIIGDIVRFSHRRTDSFSKYAISRCI